MIMIAWERRHNNTDTELIFRYDGFVEGGAPPADCCILLETGAPDEVLLEDGTGCIQPEDC